jgi:LysM repeat protein
MPTRTRLAAALSATAVATPLGVIASTYVVRPGDSLSDIAVRHGTTIAALASANDIADGILNPGTMLRIPDASLGLPSYTSDTYDTELHTVAEGEQVFQVARRFGVDATALARVNGIGVNTHLDPGAVLAIPGRLSRVNALLTQIADEAGVDAAVIRAVAWVESGWQQDVVSPTGAVGIMQIEPYTGEWVSKFLALRRLDIHRARDNVTAGTLLLHHLIAVHGGDVEGALGGYYQGDQSIARNGLYNDTKRYIRVVMELIAG